MAPFSVFTVLIETRISIEIHVAMLCGDDEQFTCLRCAIVMKKQFTAIGNKPSK